MVTFPTDFTKSLEHHFSQEEVYALIVKADGLIASDGLREGFQERAFLVNSGFSESSATEVGRQHVHVPSSKETICVFMPWQLPNTRTGVLDS